MWFANQPVCAENSGVIIQQINGEIELDGEKFVIIIAEENRFWFP